MLKYFPIGDVILPVIGFLFLFCNELFSEKVLAQYQINFFLTEFNKIDFQLNLFPQMLIKSRIYLILGLFWVYESDREKKKI